MMRIADPTFERSLPRKCWGGSTCRTLDKIVVACIRCCNLVPLLRHMFNKYFVPSAPFGRKLVSNTEGSVALCMEDVLATRFRYPDRQGLLPD
jgi:hypothetical protein